MSMFTPTEEKFDPELAIDDLYDEVIRSRLAIMGLCVAMTMHIVGTYIIVRNLRNKLYRG